MGLEQFSAPDADWWLCTCEQTTKDHTWRVLAVRLIEKMPSSAPWERRSSVTRRSRRVELPSESVCLPMTANLAGLFPCVCRDEPSPLSFKNRDSAKDVGHVVVRCLSDQRAVAIPAEYVDAVPSSPPVLSLPTSTGLAFHTDLMHTLWSALCEVIERDALMLWWWTRRPVREIFVEPNEPRALVDRLVRLRRAKQQVRFFDLAHDVAIPTVLAIVIGRIFRRSRPVVAVHRIRRLRVRMLSTKPSLWAGDYGRIRPLRSRSIRSIGSNRSRIMRISLATGG